MISKLNCGLLSGGEPIVFKENVEKLMTDNTLYNQLSANILEYVCNTHDKDKIIPQYESVFHSILNSALKI